jgi:hypothetical protein
LCDELCYLPLVRDVGIVENYIARSFGFIRSSEGTGAFFHTHNVLGAAPPVWTSVWYSKFDGNPRPRAIPVVPMKPNPAEE